MPVQSLGWEDSPEEGMATHSSMFSWRIPWTEEPGRLQSTGSQRIGPNWSDLAHTHTHLSFTHPWVFTWWWLSSCIYVQETSLFTFFFHSKNKRKWHTHNGLRSWASLACKKEKAWGSFKGHWGSKMLSHWPRNNFSHSLACVIQDPEQVTWDK